MTGETILITRPKGDEQPLAEALHALGLRVIHEPLQEIFLLHHERQGLHQALQNEPDAILITSRHGVQALALLTEMRDLPLLCVGDATEEAAQSQGFTRTSSAGGNAQSLIDYVMAGYDPESRFLYVSGANIRTDIAAALNAEGMQAERLTLYEAIPSEQLSDTLVEQLKRGQIDAVTFFSPRAAGIFHELLDKENITESTAGLQAFCLSEAVAEALKPELWRAIHTATEATLASLVGSVDNAF